VVNPQGCKNNCPACARICPQTALIFPKYKYGGAIGGSEEIDEVEEKNRQTQDISDLLGGDIYVALERRKLKRRSIIMEEAMRKAVEEKEKAVSGITGN
jgi:ferredoxin